MASKRHLAKSPLVEAVIDIRISPLEPFTEAMLATLKSMLAEQGFPKGDPLFHFTGNFKLEAGAPEASVAQQEGVFGYRFVSADTRSVVQFRRNGFTYSRLRPYTSWEDVRQRAYNLWVSFTSWTKPDAVERLALRYINHLDFPSSRVDLGEYLTAPPSIPPELPQDAVRFLSTVLIHDSDCNAYINLTHATADVKGATNIEIVLDLDIYKNISLGPCDEKIWELFEQLHQLKDKTFFSCITERTADLFE